jgi:hypothetical protein
MTLGAGGPNFNVMRNRALTSNGLIVIALTAVFSLAAGHLADLGAQLLGAGPALTPVLIGDGAGLIACALSALYGLRGLSRARTC